MSAFIVGILKFTCGLLVNNARSKIAERVKHDEDYLSWILGELDDIKGKLDGLARKDLGSSISFLHEGINKLDQCLQQCKQIEDTSKSTGQATSVEAASPRGVDNGSPINKAIAFRKALASSEIASSQRFKSARKSFEIARTKATDAFCNNALSIEDRIQASQVRVTARILENLEDPNQGVSDCFQYLRELHDVGDIKDIFSVLINGGVKAKLKMKKGKKLNNARLVHLMNQLLFEFAGEYASLPPRSFTEWPTILFGEKSYHPVFGDCRLIEKLQDQDSSVRVMSPYPHFKFDDKIFPPHSVVNSKGEIIAELYKENTIKMFQWPERSRTFCEIPNEKPTSLCRIVAMDIDAEDNLYVLAGFQENNDEPWSYKLFIFDENGKKTLESPLTFLENSSWIKLRMAVNRDGKVAILNCDEKMMYTRSPSGVEPNSKSFNGTKVDNELSRTGRGNMRFSDLKIICASRMTVNIYTEGMLERKIKLPERHGFITSIAIDHTTTRILIETSILADRFSVLCFSETGKLIYSLYLCLDKLCLKHSKWIEYAKLTSHPNGAVALVGETGAALLQL